MKKLNNKGYLVVEIILASVLAFIIAAFLIELTVRLTNKEEDAYLDTTLTTNKMLVTKKIIEDIEKYGIGDIIDNDVVVEKNSITYINESTKTGISFNYKNNTKTLLITKEDNNLVLTYDSVRYILSNNSSIFSEISYDIKENTNYYNVKLTLKNIYSSKDYGFNLIVVKKPTGVLSLLQ